MSGETFTRILSPNLGCPEILAPEQLNGSGLHVVLAVPEGQADWDSYGLKAEPSYAGEGKGFELLLGDPELLDRSDLPKEFDEVESTRRLISTFLRSRVLPRHTFWSVPVNPRESIGESNLRRVASHRRATLYDLVLMNGDKVLSRVRHALCLRPPNPSVRFIHLTDLHVAARNDLWETEVKSTVGSKFVTSGDDFCNFNQRLRKFILAANEASDIGQLDFVLALGDLVDFARSGVTDRGPGDNNWSTLVHILTGSPAEQQLGNPGLRVPLFTTTGNHDWRPYPYPPEVNSQIFGISKPCANELDAWYHDTSAEVGEKIKDVHERLIREGSPVLARSWWGSLTSMGLRGLSVGFSRLYARTLAVLTKYLRETLVALALGSVLGTRAAGGQFWNKFEPIVIAIAAVAAVVMAAGQRRMYSRLRKTLEAFIAIETDATGLSDYFLKLNPYFNYAFRLENCYFMILDTGHDCLTAESFWDDGAKKLGPVSVNDNILGGSPDTMAFYPPNEHYPYSQIAWMENVLALIRREQGQRAGEPRTCRIFAGLHTPVANLSKGARRQADGQLSVRGNPLFMPEGRIKSWFNGAGLDGYDIRYGTVNHYLSEFYYLCLGYREQHRQAVSGPGIDAVLSGHAHWSIEFKLRKPANHPDSWKPEILYGRFSEDVEQGCSNAADWWGPLLLQTGACGPPSASDPDTPNFRYVTVDSNMAVCHLRPRTLSGPLPWTIAQTAAAGQHTSGAMRSSSPPNVRD